MFLKTLPCYDTGIRYSTALQDYPESGIQAKMAQEFKSLTIDEMLQELESRLRKMNLLRCNFLTDLDPMSCDDTMSWQYGYAKTTWDNRPKHFDFLFKGGIKRDLIKLEKEVRQEEQKRAAGWGRFGECGSVIGWSGEDGNRNGTQSYVRWARKSSDAIAVLMRGTKQLYMPVCSL